MLCSPATQLSWRKAIPWRRSAHEESQGFAVEAGEFGKLDHVHAALAWFTLRDKRPRATQLLGYLHLRQLRLVPSFPQLRQEQTASPMEWMQAADGELKLAATKEK